MGMRLQAVDGLRSLAHISLVCLHSAMLLTGKLPAVGPLWRGFSSSLPFTFFQAGGIQVDIMFLLSGFLLVFNTLRKPLTEMPSLLHQTLKRALRMMPMMIVTILLGHFVIKDCWGMPYTFWDGGKAIPARVMSLLLFYTNYCDQITHGSFLGSLMWSCAVDLQVGIFIFLIIKICGYFYREKDEMSFFRFLRKVFVVLLLLSSFIRGSIFDRERINMVQLGQYVHFRLLQPRSSYTWMEEFFGHKWQTAESAIDKTHEYLNRMYFPAHARFGPFMVGGIVACSVLLSNCEQESSSMKPSHWLNMGTLLSWIFTVVSFFQLLVPCLPAPPIDEVPVEAQLFVTAALRNLSACSAGLLLYRALVPSDHPWYSTILSSFLSLSCWKHVAAISFCSYLIHFRLLMEVIYSESMQQLFGIAFPATSLPDDASAEAMNSLITDWIFIMVKVFVIGIFISFLLAKILHELIEKPLASVIDLHFFQKLIESRKKAL